MSTETFMSQISLEYLYKLRIEAISKCLSFVLPIFQINFQNVLLRSVTLNTERELTPERGEEERGFILMPLIQELIRLRQMGQTHQEGKELQGCYFEYHIKYRRIHTYKSMYESAHESVL